ncbi:RHS repeat domain-containing protein [Lysinibacillus capsici]|uniref:RHS repeat domain-containing protein n=1 Tax=Lysinibacillus capsici TaxID=2115968 RepID=UPI002646C429|nr:RHS repeat-associated core domain-containing protein [Lysinibacillus capsici]
MAEYTYDAWGNNMSQSGTMATINPYRYAGYRYDEDTKLYYLIARYYNPVMNVDPDGEWVWLWWMAKGALLGGFIAWVKYKVEVKLGIQRANRNNMLVQIGIAASIGAVTGGIGVSNINKVSGLLKLAKNKKYLTSKEIKIANYFIYGQYSALKSIANKFNTNPGKLTWKEVIYREVSKWF